MNKTLMGVILLKNALLLDDSDAIKHEIRMAISNFEPGYDVTELPKEIALSDLGFVTQETIETKDRFG